MKTTYYVATLACYALVDAEDESQAREVALPRLHALHAEQRERLGHDAPIQIRTIRPATKHEIELQRLRDEMVDRHGGSEIITVDRPAKHWIVMSIPGRENVDGTETPTHWFAYDKRTRKCICFETRLDAERFVNHPDHQ